ncbi:hypothetical protein Zmor_023039 [Zophobas morio]|uniref:Uncharacterized protein n=1 Tax=Zophobas morio TaxID=2755281 RepID=A0AA38HW87_9CUCU|nr:hypothetical protein Zmor_023039 [Zophobas morio]
MRGGGVPRCQALSRLVPLKEEHVWSDTFTPSGVAPSVGSDGARVPAPSPVKEHRGCSKARDVEIQVVWGAPTETRNKIKPKKINNNRVYSLPPATWPSRGVLLLRNDGGLVGILGAVSVW